MLKNLYHWTMKLSESRHAPIALAAVSFAESSFFPIPPDIVLVPMALAQPKKAFQFALICTVFSVLGGMLGYAIGALLYETVGQWLIHMYGYASKITEMQAFYAKWGWALILIKGLTPIPYKLVTIFSGLMQYNFALFIVLSFVTRGARFFIEAGLLNRFGDPIKAQLEKNFIAIVVTALLLVVVGFVVAVKVL